jgi:single-stranded DNA-binding protein
MYMYMSLHSIYILSAVSERFRTAWHLLNVRNPRLRDIILDNIYKGTRLMVNGRLEYTQSTREDGSTREYTVIVVGE